MRPDIPAPERATPRAAPASRIASAGPLLLRAFPRGTGRANAASAPDPGLAGRMARIAAGCATLALPPLAHDAGLGMEKA